MGENDESVTDVTLVTLRGVSATCENNPADTMRNFVINLLEEHKDPAVRDRHSIERLLQAEFGTGDRAKPLLETWISEGWLCEDNWQLSPGPKATEAA